MCHENERAIWLERQLITEAARGARQTCFRGCFGELRSYTITIAGLVLTPRQRGRRARNKGLHVIRARFPPT
jgi:hypothetical protein